MLPSALHAGMNKQMVTVWKQLALCVEQHLVGLNRLLMIGLLRWIYLVTHLGWTPRGIQVVQLYQNLFKGEDFRTRPTMFANSREFSSTPVHLERTVYISVFRTGKTIQYQYQGPGYGSFQQDEYENYFLKVILGRPSNGMIISSTGFDIVCNTAVVHGDRLSYDDSDGAHVTLQFDTTEKCSEAWNLIRQ